MYNEIPQYTLRAYSLFYSKYGSKESFRQTELDWIVSTSMKKKIFNILLKAGWLIKESRHEYRCVDPQKVIEGLLDFKVPEIIKISNKIYAFTNLSAIEIWSDYSYVQRALEKSPYFIKILKKDTKYWKEFFAKYNIPAYENKGSNIGEYIILIPVTKLKSFKKGGLNVESLKETLNIAKQNEMFSYPYHYILRKYGQATN